MKLQSYRISTEALEDLEKIWVYTFHKWSADQADRYYSLIINEIEFLTENFNSGKSIEHVRDGYRSVKVKSHLIFYRLYDDQKLEVVRILHQNMDVDDRLK
jgi:toxin ParE1/3/4